MLECSFTAHKVVIFHCILMAVHNKKIQLIYTVMSRLLSSTSFFSVIVIQDDV